MARTIQAQRDELRSRNEYLDRRCKDLAEAAEYAQQERDASEVVNRRLRDDLTKARDELRAIELRAAELEGYQARVREGDRQRLIEQGAIKMAEAQVVTNTDLESRIRNSPPRDGFRLGDVMGSDDNKRAWRYR